MTNDRPLTSDGVPVTSSSVVWTGVEDASYMDTCDFRVLGHCFCYPRPVDLAALDWTIVRHDDLGDDRDPCWGIANRDGTGFMSLRFFYSSPNAAWEDFLSTLDREIGKAWAIAAHALKSDEIVRPEIRAKHHSMFFADSLSSIRGYEKLSSSPEGTEND